MSVAAPSPVNPPPVASAESISAPFDLEGHGLLDDYVAMEPTASGSGVQTLWHPPEPSMDTLPVDASKTEPKPAYYKLQFGDDYTGFSYYVRTLAVIIGRKVEKPMSAPPPDIRSPPQPAIPPLDMDGDINMDLMMDANLDSQLLAMMAPDTSLSDSLLPPPPPPPEASGVDHVDVDLGPLKSVSRNHAKIEYRSDLGHFCLEILGRNGAWVDDRYYVKGSVVPLKQGSVIQIATRIFSFILPPSPDGSSYPSPYAAEADPNSPLEDVPWPYNLPADQLTYTEFFEAPPVQTAGHVPQPFNAFAAADGHGLGLGMGEETDKRFWDEEWDSSSRDSWEEEGGESGSGSGEEESDSDSELSELSSDASSSVEEDYEAYGRVRLQQRKPSQSHAGGKGKGGKGKGGKKKKPVQEDEESELSSLSEISSESEDEPVPAPAVVDEEADLDEWENEPLPPEDSDEDDEYRPPAARIAASTPKAAFSRSESVASIAKVKLEIPMPRPAPAIQAEPKHGPGEAPLKGGKLPAKSITAVKAAKTAARKKKESKAKAVAAQEASIAEAEQTPPQGSGNALQAGAAVSAALASGAASATPGTEAAPSAAQSEGTSKPAAAPAAPKKEAKQKASSKPKPKDKVKQEPKPATLADVSRSSSVAPLAPPEGSFQSKSPVMTLADLAAPPPSAPTAAPTAVNVPPTIVKPASTPAASAGPATLAAASSTQPKSSTKPQQLSKPAPPATLASLSPAPVPTTLAALTPPAPTLASLSPPAPQTLASLTPPPPTGPQTLAGISKPVPTGPAAMMKAGAAAVRPPTAPAAMRQPPKGPAAMIRPPGAPMAPPASISGPNIPPGPLPPIRPPAPGATVRPPSSMPGNTTSVTVTGAVPGPSNSAGAPVRPPPKPMSKPAPKPPAIPLIDGLPVFGPYELPPKKKKKATAPKDPKETKVKTVPKKKKPELDPVAAAAAAAAATAASGVVPRGSNTVIPHAEAAALLAAGRPIGELVGLKGVAVPGQKPPVKKPSPGPAGPSTAIRPPVVGPTGAAPMKMENLAALGFVRPPFFGPQPRPLARPPRPPAPVLKKVDGAVRPAGAVSGTAAPAVQGAAQARPPVARPPRPPAPSAASPVRPPTRPPGTAPVRPSGPASASPVVRPVPVPTAVVKSEPVDAPTGTSDVKPTLPTPTVPLATPPLSNAIPPSLARPDTPGKASRPPLVSTPTAASSPGGTPEPPKPFYLTELIETPGRPAHIVVNVPIPPSGGGPRPPPGPMLGLDGMPFIGPAPIKPTVTFASIIYTALANLPRGRGTLGEVCNWIAGEWEWFRLNVDSVWQNSIRHNLSLNKAFLKVPRIPEDDPESKGSVWVIDPTEGPLFEEKQRKEASKMDGKAKAEVKAAKEKKLEAQAKTQREVQVQQMQQPQQQAIQQTHAAQRAVQAAQARQLQPLPVPGQVRPVPPVRPSMPTVRPARPPVRPAIRPSTSSPAVRPVRPVPARPPPPAPAPAEASTPAPPPPRKAPERVEIHMTPITPAMRAKNTLPQAAGAAPATFTSDGKSLFLDPTTFGHLTAELLDKLSTLGVDMAASVLTNFVQTRKTKADAATGAATPAKAAPAVSAVRPVGAATNGVVRPRPPPKQQPKVPRPPKPTTNGATSNGNTAPRPPAPRPPVASAAAGPSRPPRPPAASAGGVPARPPAAQPQIIGIISRIASAANSKQDVSVVGKNAHPLLAYLKAKGTNVNIQVAEEIWRTGILPPDYKSGPGGIARNGSSSPAPQQGAGARGTGGAAPGVGSATLAPGARPAGLSPGATPSPASAAPALPHSATGPATARMNGTPSSSIPSQLPKNVALSGAVAANSTPVPTVHLEASTGGRTSAGSASASSASPAISATAQPLPGPTPAPPTNATALPSGLTPATTSSVILPSGPGAVPAGAEISNKRKLDAVDDSTFMQGGLDTELEAKKQRIDV